METGTEVLKKNKKTSINAALDHLSYPNLNYSYTVWLDVELQLSKDKLAEFDSLLHKI